MTTTTTTTYDLPFSVYFASLSDYNAGLLHGVWVDFNQCDDADDVRSAISSMLASSPADYTAAGEYAIHDYSLPVTMHIPEHADIDVLWAFYSALRDLPEDDVIAFCDFLENEAFPTDVEAMNACVENFSSVYQGSYDSEADFAEYIVDYLGLLAKAPEELQYYFDYERYGRDLFLSGDYWMSKHNFVFSASY